MGDLVGLTLDFGDDRPYVLERRLGRGGMGEVYLATRTSAGGSVERVAMKVVRRDLVGMLRGDVRPFLDEARLHQCLRHPNVVQARCLLEKDDTFYLMMDYLDGKSLRALFELARRKGRRLSEASICHVFAQALDALDYVHQATDAEGKPLHVVHRDVSPSNVFVTSIGETKLLDFGVAKSTQEGRLETRSSERVYQGKLGYLSPEQANHEPLDGRSDLFSLGCVLAEALTGRNPFEVGTDPDVIDTIRKVTPDFVESALRGVPEGLQAICRKLLAREPSGRFAAAKEVGDALRTYARRRGYRQDAAQVANEMAELESLPDAKVPAAFLAASAEQRLGKMKQGWRITLIASAALVLAAVTGFIAGHLPPNKDRDRHREEAWRKTLSQDRTPMPLPTPNKAPVTEEKKPAAAPPSAASTRRTRTPSAGSCLQALQTAGMVLAMSACPPVHVPTHTKTGDCTLAPAREIDGYAIPEIIAVRFVSLNGKNCEGSARWPCTPDVPFKPCIVEPCPAEKGAIVLEELHSFITQPPTPEELYGSRFYGQAWVVEGREFIWEQGMDQRRWSTGRLMVLITRMQLRPGVSVPVCGVLYDAGDVPPPANPKLVLGREGIVILDSQYYGKSGTHTMAYGKLKLFWP